MPVGVSALLAVYCNWGLRNKSCFSDTLSKNFKIFYHW